ETTSEEDLIVGLDPVHGEPLKNIHGEDVWKEPLREKEIETELDRVFHWMNHPTGRSHTRVPVRFTVEVAQNETIHHGTCLNLSQGGMFIAIECPPPPGAEVLLEFAPPLLACPMATTARVAWVRGGGSQSVAVAGMGVQFLDPEPSMAGLIGSVVDRLSQQISPSPDSAQVLPPSH
ncbi:MAG: PilZ domain-containing protein, partial [Candidatus Methylomirabilales bacterium]